MAARAITSGSEPNNCAVMGCSSGSKARYFMVRVGLRVGVELAIPCELVNSVMIRPHPPRSRIMRRKTVSVTPAMGASTVAGAMATPPIRSSAGKCVILYSF